MVPNGNFEAYSLCPTSISAVSQAPPWRPYHQGTSDYFHACCGSCGLGVPVNGWGYQYAANGNGYMGGFSFANRIALSGATEYIASPMTPMTTGTHYEVSMSVNLSDNSSYGNNGLGIWFYDVGASTTLTTGFATLTVVPQVHYTNYGVLTDTQNWVRLSKIYLADSAYDNLVIGKFDPVGGLDTASIKPLSGSSISYYFFDSVVIRVASGVNNLYADSLICAGDTFSVPYTLNSFRPFGSTNVFTAQLSNASGSFSSGTTIIGTRTSNAPSNITCVVPGTITPGSNYRIRILASNPVDSSYPNQHYINVSTIRPIVSNTNSGPVCPGNTLNLFATSSITGISYQWTGPNGFTSLLQNPVITSTTLAADGNYIVKTRLIACVSRDTTYGVVLSGSSINATASNPACENDTIKLNSILVGNPTSFHWAGPGTFASSSKDTFRTNASASMDGDYILTVTYPGCVVKDTIAVQVIPLATGRTLSSNSPVCIGDTLKLYASSSSTNVSYTWIGPNGFIQPVQNATRLNVTSLAAGVYNVIYNRNGCPVKDSLTVAVNPTPLTIIASSNAPLCEADTLRLNATNSSSGVSWSWTGPNSFSASVQNPVLPGATSAAAGNYLARATFSSTGCNSKDTVTVQVKPLPANFNATANTICEGNTLFLSGNTTRAGFALHGQGLMGLVILRRIRIYRQPPSHQQAIIMYLERSMAAPSAIRYMPMFLPFLKSPPSLQTHPYV